MLPVIVDACLGLLLLYLFVITLRHAVKGSGEARIVALLCALCLLPALAIIHWYGAWDFTPGSRLQDAARWWTVPISDADGHPNGMVNLLAVVPLLAIFYIVATILLSILASGYLRRYGTPLQNLHRGLLKWLLVSLGFIVYLKFQGVSLTPIFFGMGALSIVVGLALQDPMSNLFAGLALDVEGNVQPGDWVRIDVDGGTEGKVLDKGWRTTRLLTLDQALVTLPNRVLGGQKILNYYRPDRVHGHRLHVSASYQAPPAKVKDVLRTVLLREPHILKDPRPVVRTINFGASAIDYEMRFFINDFSHLMDVKDEVMTRVWYAFRDNDIEIPFPIRTVYLKERAQVEEEVTRQRRQVEDLAGFFQGLSCLNRHLGFKDCEYLAQNAVEKAYAPGEALILKGTMGDAVFFIRSGWCQAYLGDGRHKRIETGEYVGEMALLRFAPRTTDVRAGETGATGVRVDRESLLRLFRFYPGLREEFVVTMHDRRQETQSAEPEMAPGEETLGCRLRRAAKKILHPW